MPKTESNAVADAATSVIRARVLVFFDYACQFCYLDWPRFKRLRSEHDADLFLAPYELRPAMPAEGVSLAELGAGHSPRVEDHMRKMAREGGLRLTFPDFVPNTHYALAVSEYARDIGPEAHEAVHEALFEAYNADGRDIGQLDVCVEVAETHALDAADVRSALLEGRYDERLHQFYHLALSFGVTATPSALICNELFIGSRPYKVLEDAVNRCLITADNIAEHAEHDHDAAHDHQAHGDDEPLDSGSDAEHSAEGRPPTISH